MNRAVVICICTLSFLWAASLGRATDFWVAPDGNDQWSGRYEQPQRGGKDGPLRTVAAALAKTRALAPGEVKRILVRAGKYFLAAQLVLDARDSGLTIEAAGGGAAVLYGGQRISGWEREGNRYWSAEVPALGGKPWRFRLLCVNDQARPPARFPAAGFFEHDSEFPVRWLGTNKGGWERKPTAEELSELRYRPEDIGSGLDFENAEVTVYHMWDESLVKLRGLDTSRNRMLFATPSGHPPGAFGVRKYVVWNTPEGMNEPGQWYLDARRNRVVYWPSPGEDPGTAEVVAPTMESIIRLEGTQEAPVRHVTLRGLALAVTDAPAVAGGFGASQYAGALAVSFAEQCRFEDLSIYNTAGQGIKAIQTTAVELRGLEVRDTGASGIYLRGKDAVIEDNHVFRVGVRYPSAIGIFCGGEGLRVRHNEIHDTPYTAINCGGADHRIESNLIYRAMMELHDGAAIYFIFGKRLVIRGNLVRDIPDTGGYGSSAYYIDEMSEGCVVEQNVSIGVARPSHNHWAQRNTIRNNVFLHEGEMRITLPRSSEFRFERNVLRSRGRILMENASAITSAEGNLFFSESRQVEGAPSGTLIADPLVRERGRIFDFDPQSPARRLGIPAVDVSGAGRRSRHR